MTYGGTPKPLGPEYEALEKAGRAEQEAERQHIRLEVEAREAADEARAGRQPTFLRRLVRRLSGWR
jgi:hypothetical protein